MLPQDSLWPLPPADLQIAIDNVHVWRAVLNQPAPVVQCLFFLLSPDERDRAAAFHFQKDREHFIVARGALRSILGRYLHLDPAQLRFTYNKYGKPALRGTAAVTRLHFSLSHSGGLALYAFNWDRQIGLDIEFVKDDIGWEEIAEQFFSIREIAMLRALPIRKRAEGFFNCWTRKEAYVKAKGEGLSLPLADFDVSLAPGEPAILLSASNPEESSRWTLKELAPCTGYAAAVAVEGANWNLECWSWDRASGP